MFFRDRVAPEEAIDHALREWNGDLASKHAVVRYMREHSLDANAADWLRQAYGDDMPAFPVVADGVSTDIPWTQVRDRLARLIHEDRFYTTEEQDHFDDIDPVAIRGTLAQRGIVDGKVVDKAALYQSTILQQVNADAERVGQAMADVTPSLIPIPPAVNFRITDDDLDTGGVKAKYGGQRYWQGYVRQSWPQPVMPMEFMVSNFLLIIQQLCLTILPE